MTYDQWKLSNPIDDGYGYDMVSNCCGTKVCHETDVCLKCAEHCDLIEEYEYEEIQKENYLEERNDAKRKYRE